MMTFSGPERFLSADPRVAASKPSEDQQQAACVEIARHAGSMPAATHFYIPLTLSDDGFLRLPLLIWQRNDCTDCHAEALADTQLVSIIEAWSALPTHVGEAILTLVRVFRQLGHRIRMRRTVHIFKPNWP